MLQATIWNKTSAINGVSASEILASNPRWVDATIFLVADSTNPDRTLRIEEMGIIRANGGYAATVSDNEVIEAYLEQANAPVVAAEPMPTTTELSIMEGLATIYEQNLQILNQ